MSDGPNRRGTRRVRPALAGLVALVPLIPIAIALTLSGGNGVAVGTAAARSPFSAVGLRQAAPRRRIVAPGRGSLVALVEQSTQLRSSPGGHAYARLGPRTEFGSPQAMLVVRTAGAWLGVLSPQAGNGHVGWIRASSASLSRVDWTLEVSLAARQLTVRHAGRVLERYRVAIGAPASPTPTGRFAVTDRLRPADPSGAYGCCILALSAVAPHAIQGWSGGNRIAIHSTPEASSIGEPVSHGCLRLTLAEGRWLLGHVPLGTPTVIRT